MSPKLLTKHLARMCGSAFIPGARQRRRRQLRLLYHQTCRRKECQRTPGGRQDRSAAPAREAVPAARAHSRRRAVASAPLRACERTDAASGAPVGCAGEHSRRPKRRTAVGVNGPGQPATSAAMWGRLGERSLSLGGGAGAPHRHAAVSTGCVRSWRSRSLPR